MKLYSKKLSNQQDLLREKRKLQKELLKLEEEGFFSSSEDADNSKEDESGNPLGGFSIASLLPLLSNFPLAGTITSFATQWVTNRFFSGNTSSSEKAKQSTEPSKPGIVRRVATEVITGYLKWKAIELSYKGVRYLINQRKKKKAAEAAQ